MIGVNEALSKTFVVTGRGVWHKRRLYSVNHHNQVFSSLVISSRSISQSFVGGRFKLVQDIHDCSSVIVLELHDSILNVVGNLSKLLVININVDVGVGRGTSDKSKIC